MIQDTPTNKNFALKTIKYSSEDKIQKLLDSEVKASSQLKHDNIIRCYSTYFFEGSINFVFEYMDKGTLADVLKNAIIIPEDILGIIAYQIIKGLAYLQKEKKIIHRDLKPSNILLNSKGFVKISDFGLSTFVEGSWALKRTMIGTYLYMSPERFNAKGYYSNADIWSLGIILMECSLGYYPYNAYNDYKPLPDIWTVQEVIEKNLAPILDDTEYSQECVEFVSLCLTKDVKIRPTAYQLLSHPFICKYKNVPKTELKAWLSKLN